MVPLVESPYPVHILSEGRCPEQQKNGIENTAADAAKRWEGRPASLVPQIDPWFDLVYHGLAHLDVPASDASRLFDAMYVLWVEDRWPWSVGARAAGDRTLSQDAPLMADLHAQSGKGYLLNLFPLLWDGLDPFRDQVATPLSEIAWLFDNGREDVLRESVPCQRPDPGNRLGPRFSEQCRASLVGRYSAVCSSGEPLPEVVVGQDPQTRAGGELTDGLVHAAPLIAPRCDFQREGGELELLIHGLFLGISTWQAIEDKKERSIAATEAGDNHGHTRTARISRSLATHVPPSSCYGDAHACTLRTPTFCPCC